MVNFIRDILTEKEGLTKWLGLLLFFASTVANAQSSAGGNLQVTASVVPAVSITCSAGSDGSGNINFGLVLPRNTATIDSRTSTYASLFTVHAGSDVQMTTTFSSPTVTLLDSLNNSLSFIPSIVGAQLSSSQSSATSISSGGVITMSSSGLYYIWLGGYVTVPSSGKPGNYSGTFNLTVTY